MIFSNGYLSQYGKMILRSGQQELLNSAKTYIRCIQLVSEIQCILFRSDMSNLIKANMSTASIITIF